MTADRVSSRSGGWTSQGSGRFREHAVPWFDVESVALRAVEPYASLLSMRSWAMRSWVRRGLYDILFGLLTVSGCQKTAPGPVAGATVSGSASSAGTAAAADGGADVRRASASYHDVGVRTHDGTTWVWGERVDADVVHAKRVAALFVEANEIRCPRVIRSKSASVPKDINPWLIDGDVVEVDELWAHSVSARIIIATRSTRSW